MNLPARRYDTPLPTPRTDRWDRAIDALDPERDAHAITTILSNHIYPVDTLLAVELAQLRTFTIPTISGLLHRTGQFERDGVKRLDDTKAILSEILIPGPAHPDTQPMIAHLNRIHGMYPISNDDYLYTLSTFLFDPLIWIQTYSWRPIRPKEQLAVYHVYRELGERMGIEAIPESIEAFWSWRLDYEARAQRFEPSNRQVTDGMLAAVGKMLPAPLRPLVRPVVAALIVEDRFVEALGLKRPPAWFCRVVRGVMGLRKRIGPHVTLWERARFWETRFFNTYATYPTGYERMRLGPDKVLRALEREDARAGSAREEA